MLELHFENYHKKQLKNLIENLIKINPLVKLHYDDDIKINALDLESTMFYLLVLHKNNFKNINIKDFSEKTFIIDLKNFLNGIENDNIILVNSNEKEVSKDYEKINFHISNFFYDESLIINSQEVKKALNFVVSSSKNKKFIYLEFLDNRFRIRNENEIFFNITNFINHIKRDFIFKISMKNGND